jgi:hypothetical protein
MIAEYIDLIVRYTGCRHFINSVLISMSADGFIAGANVHPEADWAGLADGGDGIKGLFLRGPKGSGFSRECWNWSQNAACLFGAH